MRVIAGSCGGRRLVAPSGETTRPTTDRVREALFSILNGHGVLEGARVLDLYAGTGALGIEALSRGAAAATFVESSRPALVALRENVRSLGLEDQVEIVAAPADRWLRSLRPEAPPYTLVLADPPWADVARAQEVLAALVKKGHLAPDALVVLEHASRDVAMAVAGLERVDARAWGDTAVWLGSPPAGSPPG